MGSFGGRLQREREMRGISLDEIAEATKIGTRSLRALEAEDFEKLPGGIFNKGFVRAYAKFLGIDEEQAVADYMAAVGEKPAGALPAGEAVNDESGPKLAVTEVTESDGSTAAALRLLAVVVLVIAAVAVGGWKLYQVRAARAQARTTAEHLPVAPVSAPQKVEHAAVPQTSAQAVPEPTSPTAQPPSKEAGKSAPEMQAAAGVPPAPLADGEFELQIHAREDSWMSITADGKQVMNGTLKAASNKSVRARDKVVVRVGNAGGVDVSLNGKPMPTLGDAGQTRTATFTATGLQQ